MRELLDELKATALFLGQFGLACLLAFGAFYALSFLADALIPVIIDFCR